MGHTQSSIRHSSNWVLTFGDSLTAGYYFSGRKFAPYSCALQKLLRREPDFEKIIVRENGASGKTASELNKCASEYKTQLCVCCREYLNLKEALHRGNTPGLTRKESSLSIECTKCGKDMFPGQLYVKSEHGNKLYRCHVSSTPAVPDDFPALCIIMLGTNDLCNRRAGEKIAEDIIALHTLCHKHGVATICIEVPPNYGTTDGFNDREYQSRYRKTNEVLKRWASTCSDCTYMAFPFPFNKADLHQEDGLWDDQLHMKAAGYRVLAEHLAPVVAKVLRGRMTAIRGDTKAPATTTAAAAPVDTGATDATTTADSF